jgi:cellulose synthase/poly-beta-1,6-N-acetylglucosamine synthase-like glycosyltransferase
MMCIYIVMCREEKMLVSTHQERQQHNITCHTQQEDGFLPPLHYLIYKVQMQIGKRERPYQHDSTASRLLSEVRHVRAWLVLRWGTTLESQVLFSFLSFLSFIFFFLFSFFFYILFYLFFYIHFINLLFCFGFASTYLPTTKLNSLLVLAGLLSSHLTISSALFLNYLFVVSFLPSFHPFLSTIALIDHDCCAGGGKE